MSRSDEMKKNRYQKDFIAINLSSDQFFQIFTNARDMHSNLPKIE